MKVEQTNFVTHLIITAVPDPDLEIKWRGGGGGGFAHPDPYIREGGWSPKNIFRPSGLSLV